MPEINPAPPQKQDSSRLEVRINHIDYVLAPPGELDNSCLPSVPVLRIFGASSIGQTACVHVHQIYPYFYVEYPGKLNPRHVRKYISKLSRSLNYAVAFSLKKDPLSPKSQYVRAIVLVKGVHFYGFHASYTLFLKIYAANPILVTRMVSILQSGSVMGKLFRVFESHLSYILQFLCDFDLYGCGLIRISDALERCPEGIDDGPGPSTPAEPVPIKFKASSYFRESRLALEIDIIPAYILNRHRLCARNINHRLDTAIPNLPSDPLILSIRELWEDERKDRQAHGLDPSPEIPVDPSDSSRDTSGEWISEARWWDGIRQRIQRESTVLVPKPEESEHDWERSVMTTFESIEALWEKEYRTWRPEKLGKERIEDDVKRTDDAQPPDYSWDVQNQTGHEEEDGQVDVNTSMFSDQEIDRLDREEEDRWNGDAQQLHGVEEEKNDDVDEEDDIHEEDFQPDSPNILPEELGDKDVDPFMGDPGSLSNVLQQKYELNELPAPSTEMFEDREGSPTPVKSSNHYLHNSATPDASVETEKVLPLICNLDLDLTPTKSNPHPITLASQLSQALPQFSHSGGEGKSPDIPNGTSHASEKAPVGTLSLTAEKRYSLITARAVKLSKAFDNCKSTNSNQYVYSPPPPSFETLSVELKSLGLPSKIYQPPHYSRDEDIPDQPKEYAGLLYRLKGGQGITFLEEWQSDELSPKNYSSRAIPQPQLDPSGVGGWEYANHPPSVREVRRSLHLLHDKLGDVKAQPSFKSQIEGPTQSNIFKATAMGVNKQSSRKSANMSVMSMEVFVPTHEDKVPNPQSDEVKAIFCAYQISGTDDFQTSVLVLEGSHLDCKRLRYPHVIVLTTELDLITKLFDIVMELDPDIITGWEVQNSSWGYLEKRGAIYDISLSEYISRAPQRFSGDSVDRWALQKASTLKIVGRHVLNLWRIMRSEKNLTIYTFEHVVYEVLRRRVPRYSNRALTDWYYSEVPADGSYLFQHVSMHVIVNLQLLEATEVITKTAEFARVFGVDFFSVLTRGSQFKVESFMFRLAKPESFVLHSPSKAEVGRQNGAECMPLIMEPQSAFYSSPVLVLDFQSLYPSLMIAYNYCYSTCLGRISDFQGRNQFGVIDDLKLPPKLLEKLQGHITVAPNGMIYVKSNVRKGLLGRMLVELLETRVMVKQAMKRPGTTKARKRILDARQLSLKYIANVIYGYTSASFSGRMPAVEVADSIVQSGRETLEKAIDLIDSTAKWGAKVVYGDTDSVFVYLPGKTKEEAFAIGHEISNMITSKNPAPIKLKFEKVYLPCVLLAKKRYVGFKYESIDDVEPVFDAKGIETVRRDGVLAQRKMVETCLKILFRTQDLSEVKSYCCRSWAKLLENRAPVQDFIFAKEVKMGTYSGKGPPPPGVVIAARKMVMDPNDEPRYGDRVPYVIIRSATGARLVDRAMDPLDFMDNSELRLDGDYYITRVLIPPLERIFNLVGADIQQWFREMPKTIVPELVSPRKPSRMPMSSSPDKVEVLNGHFLSTQCLSCGDPGSQYLCGECCTAGLRTGTLANLKSRIRAREERLKNTHLVCVSCTGVAPANPIHCESLDCQWFYARRKAQIGMELVPLLSEVSDELEKTIYEIEDFGKDDLDYDFSDMDDDARYGLDSPAVGVDDDAGE